MRRYKFVSLVFYLLIITSCASARPSRQDNRPKWLTDPGSVYPDQLYITAIGEGSNRNQAIDNAAVNLTRRFEVFIEAENIFQERYKEVVELTSISSRTETQIDKTVNIGSAQKLHNITYAESYTDKLGRVYVLAYLNRFETAELYQSMIEENQKNIMYFLGKLERLTDAIPRYAYLSTALIYSYDNLTLLRQLDIIQSDYRHFIRLEYNHNELIEKITATAREITFSISLSNDESGIFKNFLAQSINELGFSIKENGLLNLSGNINIETIDLSRPQSFVRWSYNVSLKDLHDKTILTYNNSGREGHINEQEAIARAQRIIREDIQNNFKNRIFRYFEQLTLQ